MITFLRSLWSSLLVRVALALTLVGLVPVGVLAYRLIDLNRDAMEEQVELTQVRVARSTASQIGSQVGTFKSLASGLAGNTALGAPRSLEARTLLGQSLRAWADLGVAAIAVVTPEGERVIQVQLSDDRVRAWAEQLFAVPSSIAVHGQKIDDTFLLRVAAPLAANRGAVWLVADGSAILQAIDNYELEGETEVVLANRDGLAILGDVTGFSPELLEQSGSQWVDGFTSDPTADRDGFIAAQAKVSGTDWSVLSRQPLQVAHAISGSMQQASRLAIALVSVAILLFSGVAYASVVRPIRQLAQAQRRLAGVGGAGSGGELGQLRASFEALEQRLKERSALDEVFLGRFQVRSVLGSGAMGTVFLGFDPKLERPVALKTVRLDKKIPEKKRDDLLSRLIQEAVLTAKFNHPNIVAIYDVEEGEDAAFVAMEFVEGTTLEKYVWQKQRLSPDATIAIGAQMARGLAAAHADGLVHRDIKPANILLGKEGSIKITDFGIAELLTSMAPNPDVVFGTPGYLPPEALQGKGHDQSSDLFALGAILYFCLTGRRPYEGKTVKEVIRKTLFGAAKPPSQLTAGVPSELEALIMSLLSSDPASRPAGAANIAERLERLVVSREARWDASDMALEHEDSGQTSDGGGYLPTLRLGAEDQEAV